MRDIRIGERIIRTGSPPFVVAEAGINHNGNIDMAVDMVRAAREAGADAIKFQMFKAEEFVSDPALTYTYISQGREVTESMLDMFKRCEFTRDEWITLKTVCDEAGITFFSTAQNRPDLDALMELDVELVKVGSDDIVNLPMLKSFTETGLPIVFSSGMSTLAEVHTALEALGAFDGYPVVLLHCTSQYPTYPEDVNLRKMCTLTRAFPMIPVGFSDHTESNLASSLATALGACYLERHFTLDHNLPGPDHNFSCNLEELKIWVESIRTSYAMLGTEVVRPTEKEKEMIVLARRSIVTIKNIRQNERFTQKNIGLRCPGNGLPPALFETVLEKKATRNIRSGSIIQLGDLA